MKKLCLIVILIFLYCTPYQSQPYLPSGYSVPCSHCKGEGYKDCYRCNGTGLEIHEPTESECFSCNGTGWTVDWRGKSQKCVSCNGRGYQIYGKRGLVKCSYCKGKGQTPCKYCDGKGYWKF